MVFTFVQQALYMRVSAMLHGAAMQRRFLSFFLLLVHNQAAITPLIIWYAPHEYIYTTAGARAI